jgi:Transmembrane secretion effector
MLPEGGVLHHAQTTRRYLAMRHAAERQRLIHWIDLKDSAAFVCALDELGFERRRDGAFAWGIFEDAGDLGCYEEAYLIESWLELRHLRERVTNADRVFEDEIREMLIAPPRIEFLVSAERGNETRHRRAEAAGG